MQRIGQYGESGKASSLKARDYKDATDLVCYDMTHTNDVIRECSKPPRKYLVRRLTPLECCRLQGFPDWWEDGVEGSDSARYKMWGNGIALPCAVDVLGRVAKALGNDT
jgi:DNA (cytosine-5)-methyltransferase 1